MIPNSIKIPVPFDYVFPNGALFLGVDKLVDFDRLREDETRPGTTRASGSES